MTRGTRYFLTGSAVVVTLGLGTGLVAYYNGALPGLSSRAAEAEMAYLPADAAAVAFADVRAIMTSDLRKKIREALPTGEGLDAFKNEFGVDIETDIDTVAAAYMGGIPALGSAVVIVRGRFDDARISQLATSHGAEAGDYRGKRMLTMSDMGPMPGGVADHHAVAAVAFLEQGVLALGEAAAVKKAIDARATGEDIRKNAALIDVVNEVRGEGNAWFVGRINALADQTGMPSEIRDHLPAIDVFAVSLHVNGGLKGAVRAVARDDKAAEQLRDVIRGVLSGGKLVGGEDPKVQTILNSLQMTGSGRTVGLKFTVPAELMDLLHGVAASHMGDGNVIRR